jgi:predicted  nucleic acid-binding Zn-ribbon protein
MAGPAAIVREIHRLRRHGTDLQNEIDRVPRLLKAHQAKVARQEELLREGQESLKRLKVNTHEKEVLHKSTLQRIEKHERQLNEAGSKKEYDALKSEIAADRQKCLQVEDEILDSMMKVEEQTARLPELEKGIRQAKAELEEFEKSSAGRIAGLRSQFEETNRSIEEIEATMPHEIRDSFDRLIASRGEDAMAAVENRTCMACYTEITAQALNNLHIGQFTLCKSCGRVLYLPE